ncbi:MAG: arabinogalactan endo-1,4-beta-galactosidase [Anaerolineae bacterium]|nr:arabinogalactan endo-1,4-beta-galactosidase [Anaerolineae bacterium]
MYLGADLSFVNELDDLGGVFYLQQQPRDAFALFHECGANIVRVRLWHTPTVTTYSTLTDVKRTISRAKSLSMAVMLDFHYSDHWADPAKQIIPAAWAHLTDLSALENALYDYTHHVLVELITAGLSPEFVQIGNEINTEILLDAPPTDAPIRWPRNARLINAGIEAVRDAAPQARVILHIAQPENLFWWFDDATAAGVVDFDVIGLSYYPKWSQCGLDEAAQTIGKARERYQKDVMLVETAYPWTLTPGSENDHLLGADALLPEYPATPQGQRRFLTDLTQATLNHGGLGVVYWEPAWISVPAKPSHWENATFFDYQGRVHEGIQFLAHRYEQRTLE